MGLARIVPISQTSPMREIIFDTETTGLSPQSGDRIIEIGAIELENGFPTGRSFHARLNPAGRAIHPDAERVHGISAADLVDKPLFADVADGLLGFVGDAKLVAHNASFDMGFLNAELIRLKRDAFSPGRVVDTLMLARRKHPMGPNSLDALCSRYGVDNSNRAKHGALLDAELLAEVYIEMNGGRQAALLLDDEASTEALLDQPEIGVTPRTASRPAAHDSRLTAEDLERHGQFVAELGENAVWRRYSG